MGVLGDFISDFVARTVLQGQFPLGDVLSGDFAVLLGFLDSKVFFELCQISFVVAGRLRAFGPGVLKPDILSREWG